MRKNTNRILLAVTLLLIAAPFCWAADPIVTLVADKTTLCPENTLTLNITVDEATGVSGFAATLEYPSDKVELDALIPVSSVFFTMVYDNRPGADPAQAYPWESNTDTAGKLLLSGAYIDPDPTTGGGGAYTGEQVLFSVTFKVKAGAADGPVDFVLKQTQLCNGPAGWGTDVNNNGEYDELDGDAYEGAPILVKSYPKGSAEWNTPSLVDDFEVLLAAFATNPTAATSIDAADSDSDNILNCIEINTGTLFNDADTDDDGLLDGEEDKNFDGVKAADETDPRLADTDEDNIQDGTESGVIAADVGADTDLSVFQPDLDPASTTNPLVKDSDGDGIDDGVEDPNYNGRVDAGETDPTQGPPPQISNLMPALALPGAEITITGTGFGAAQGTSTVGFTDDVDADSITSWSATEIVCTIPADAEMGCVTVTTASGESNCWTLDIMGDELAFDFGASGVWNYDGLDWSQISSSDPETIASWQNGLAMDFGPIGLWNFDGITWGQLSSSDVDAMVGWADGLAMDFGLLGMWNIDADGSWRRISDSNPDNMIAWPRGLAMDYGDLGLWNIDFNGQWSTISNENPDNMVLWEKGLAMDFGPLGIWNMDSAGVWTALSGDNPETMAGWQNGLAMDFGPSGLWNIYPAGNWGRISTSDVQSLTGWTDGLAMDFGPDGIWNTSAAGAWNRVSTSDPEAILDVDFF